ncbi:MAG: hypothetical protein KIG16_04995 [Eubacteriales bacterium]|nr:hypothetical protein [Eubacteriales bacterium]
MTEEFHKEVQITATIGDIDFDEEIETYQPPKYYYVKIKMGDRYLYYGTNGAIVEAEQAILFNSEAEANKIAKQLSTQHKYEEVVTFATTKKF